MANIVLPSVDFNTAGNNVNVLTENGGAIYRTKSGDIIKQTLGNLPTVDEDNINNLRFLAEQNGELKRVSYTSNTENTSEGQNSYFDVVFTGNIETFYNNEFIEATSWFTVSHTFSDIINEAINKQAFPRLIMTNDNQNMFIATPQVFTSNEIVFNSIYQPFDGAPTLSMTVVYTNTNQIFILAISIGSMSDIEFYMDYNNNMTCNYSYEDLSYGIAMNIVPTSAKYYYGNEFVGMIYFHGISSESFSFSTFPIPSDFSHTTDIIQSFIINVNSNNTITFMLPASTLNEGRDVLWYNSNNDSVGEIYIPNIDTSQYGAFTFGGIWTYLNEEGDWSFLPDVTITTNGFSENNTPRYYLDGPSPTVYGAYLSRQVVFGSNYLSLSNGIIGLSSGEMYNDGGVMVPTVIMGIKSPQ